MSKPSFFRLNVYRRGQINYPTRTSKTFGKSTMPKVLKCIIMRQLKPCITVGDRYTDKTKQKENRISNGYDRDHLEASHTFNNNSIISSKDKRSKISSHIFSYTEKQNRDARLTTYSYRNKLDIRNTFCMSKSSCLGTQIIHILQKNAFLSKKGNNFQVLP